MKNAQYKQVKAEVEMYLSAGKPIAAAHVHDQWANDFSFKQYYELNEMIHKALEG